MVVFGHGVGVGAGRRGNGGTGRRPGRAAQSLRDALGADLPPAVAILPQVVRPAGALRRPDQASHLVLLFLLDPPVGHRQHHHQRQAHPQPHLGLAADEVLLEPERHVQPAVDPLNRRAVVVGLLPGVTGPCPRGAPNICGKTVVFVILSEAKNLAVEIATADSSPPEGGSE